MARSALFAATLLIALPAHYAAAQTYTYKTVKYDGIYSSGMADINASGMIVGGYFKPRSALRNCWTYNSLTKTKATLAYPNAEITECWGINDAGTIAGDYLAAGGLHGYTYANGTFTTIDPPGSTKTIIFGISNLGVVCGSYRDGYHSRHGFLFDGKTYTIVDIKGATEPEVFSVNSSGDYVFLAVIDHSWATFLHSGTTVTPIIFPGSFNDTQGHHLTDSGLLAITWGDSTGTLHGGAYDSIAKAYYDIDVPGSTFTIADGINTNMTIVGRYEKKGKVVYKSFSFLARGALTPHK